MGYAHGIQWTENLIHEKVKEVMDALAIDRMPTSMEIRMLKVAGLDGAISMHGGYTQMAEKMGLPSKKPMNRYASADITELIKQTTTTLRINRMPSRSEVMKMPYGGPLHNAIVRSGGYAYWAKHLNLKIKDSETKTGMEYEELAADYLEKLGYTAERMSVKYPYDLLVNGAIKVDVKVGKAYMLRGSRCHTFGINKHHATCDLYVIYALSEDGEIERVFIIPGFALNVVTMSIGTNSIYDKYIDRWDYFGAFDGFYSQFK